MCVDRYAHECQMQYSCDNAAQASTDPPLFLHLITGGRVCVCVCVCVCVPSGMDARLRHCCSAPARLRMFCAAQTARQMILRMA